MKKFVLLLFVLLAGAQSSQAQYTLPFTETFESTSSLPAGWVSWQSAGSGDFWAADFGVTTGCAFSWYNGTIWLISKAITVPAGGSVDISYYQKDVFPSYYVKHGLYYSTTGAQNLGAWTAINADLGAGDWNWALSPTYTLTGYSGTTVYVAWEYEGSFADGWYVDNVHMEVTNLCPAPTAVNATSITASNATLGWTAPASPPSNGYDIYYSTSSTPPTPSTVPTATVGAGITSYNMLSLSASTLYYAWVRSNCGGTSSSWTNVYSFTTLCNPVSVLPFNEGFESGYTDQIAVGGCWTQDGGVYETYWLANSSQTTFNRTPRTGSWDATLGMYGNGWLFRKFTLTAGMYYTVSCWAKQDGSTPSAATVELKYGSVGTPAGMTGAIQSATGLTTSYTQISGSFSPATSGDYYIGIHGVTTGPPPPYYITLDDIQVSLSYSCYPPTAITTTALCQTSASIAWTPPASAPASGYDIYYSTSSTPPTISTTPSASVAAGVTGYTMTPLTPGTTYYVWVRSNCGSGDLSLWSTVYSFSTLSTVPTAITVPGTYPNLTGVGGAFEAINCGVLSGNTTISITADLTEPGTYALNAWNENPAGSNYTLLIKPDASTLRTISGTLTYSASTPALIRTNGACRFTIDGQAGKYLTFRNTTATPAGTAGTILFDNSSQNCYLKNSTIEGNYNFSSYGTVTIGNTGNNSVEISGNDVRDATAGTIGIPQIGIYCTSTTSSLSVLNNNVYNFCELGIAVNSSGSIISGNSIFYNSPAAQYIIMYGIFLTDNTFGHVVTNNYIGGQAPLCQGSAWTYPIAGNFNGIYASGTNAGPITISNNVIRNIAMTSSGSSNFYGMQIQDGLFNIINNTVGSETVAGSITYAGTRYFHGLFLRSVNPSNVVENNIFGNWSLTAATGSPTVYGMYVYSVNAKKNKIFNISASNPALTPTIFGIWTRGAASTVYEYSNNIISLDAGAATNPIIYGFYNDGYTSMTLKFYYNDIHISGPSTGTSSTYSCYSSINSVLEFKNNIFSNLRSSGGTGKHYSIFVGNPPLTSDYNDFYSVAGPLTHYNSVDQSNLAAWKTATGQDAHSLSTDPLFVSSTDLHPQQPLLVAGTPVTGITTDYAGNTRATVPTIGAYEMPKVTTLAATSVTQTGATLNGTVNACSQTIVTSFEYGLTTSYGSSVAATPSPVTGNTSTAITAAISGLTPNSLYHYRAVGTVGSANYYGADMSFTLQSTCPEPTAVVATAITQTSAGIAWTPPASAPAGGYDIYYSTSSTPPTISTTPTASVAAGVTTYTMTPLTLGTTYYVWVRSNCGSGNLSAWSTVFSFSTHGIIPTTFTVPGNYPTLTGVGGAFEAINAGGLNGNTTINITADLIEPGTYALNAWTENPAGSNYTLLIKPDASTMRTISGTLTYSASTPALIRTNGASRFTIDGQAGKYLMFRNTTATSANTAGTILFNNGSQNCYLKNATLENNYNSTSYGTVTVGNTGNNSVEISGNDIRNATAGTIGIPAVGFYCASQTSSLNILNNNVYNCSQYGILMVTAANGAVISGNSVYYNSSTPPTGSQYGIYLMATTYNHLVSNNYIGGQAPLCQGNAWTYPGTGNFAAIYSSGTNAGTITFSGNIIRNIIMSSPSYSSFYGMKMADGLFNIMNNTVGSESVAGSITYAGTGYFYGLYLASVNADNAVDNNIFGNWSLTATSGSPLVCGIYVSSMNARKNKIFNISASNAALTADIRGILCQSVGVGTNEYSNNLISLDGGAGINSYIAGFSNGGNYSGMNFKFYYNDIHISGPPTSTGSSIAFNFWTYNNLELKNNIFSNVRGLAGSNNFVLYFVNHGALISDYNDFYTVTGPFSYYGGGNQGSLAEWKTITGQDAHTLSTDPLFVSSTDLHPTQPLLVAGTPVTGITTDYAGITRATVPTIGAYEMPQVTTLAATTVTQTAAVLNGTVNACSQNVVTSFEYGLTTAYGSTIAATPSPVTGTTSTGITASLTGLTINTLYHYRAVGTVGSVKYYGADFTVDLVPTPSITSGPTPVCAGVPGNVYTTQSGKSNYAWTVVGGTITAGGTSASNTVTVTWNTAGLQSVSVNYQNSSGIPGPSPAVYNVTVNPASVGGSITPAAVTILIGSSTGTLTLGGYTGVIQKWQRRFNGGSYTDIANTLPTYSETPGAVGVYDYRVEVMSGNCSAAYSALSTVTVNYPDLVPGTVAQSTVICSGSAAPTLTSTPPNGTSPTYQWQSSTDNIVFTNIAGQLGATYSPGALIATTYFRQMQNSTGTSGGPLPTNSVTITVNPLPVPTITGAASVCVGSTGNVYTTQAGMTNYVWNVSAGGYITAGGTSTSSTVTVTWNTAGAQSVSINYTNASGCAASAPSVYNVNVSPIPAPTISGQTNNICPGAGYNTYLTQYGFNNYIWTISSGGTIAAGQGTASIDVLWGSSGSQWLTVTYTNSAGCAPASPAQLNVTVLYLPDPAGVISGTATLCGGTQGVAYSVAPIGNATAYVWTLPAGATIASGAGTNNITVNFASNASSGNVTVYGNDVCGNGAVSPAFAVTVNPLPADAGTVSGSASVCQGSGNQVYSVPAIANATAYTWTVPSGTTIVSGQNTNTITLNFGTNAQSGSISVYGMNSCGNGAVSPAFAVTVHPKPATPVVTATGDMLTSSASSGNQWYFSVTQGGTGNIIPGATSQTYQATQTGWHWTVVNAGGCESDPSLRVYIVIVGVDELQAGNFNIFPVPNDGKFTVAMTSASKENFTITVLNNLGVQIREIRDVQVHGRFEQVINLRPVAPGIYMVVIRNSEQHIVRRIIVGK